MSKHIFSCQALARVIRAGDPKRFNVDLKNDRIKVLELASTEALSCRVDLQKFKKVHENGNVCVSYPDFHAQLVLRAITRHLQRRFRITIPNRDMIVRGVVESLMDATPMSIMRRDIKSFYESIPAAPLREKLLRDTSLPTIVRFYLEAYFNTHCSPGSTGIPRGVGLSALLSELAMADFDYKIQQIEGVYKYYRFSDDIVIFSFAPLSAVRAAVDACLLPPMTYNSKKRDDIELSQQDKNAVKEVSFDYLGYKFTTTDQCGQKDGRSVIVSMSDRKVGKLKSRIILSLESFKKHPDFTLLKDRIRFASSNFIVRRQGFALTGRVPRFGQSQGDFKSAQIRERGTI